MLSEGCSQQQRVITIQELLQYLEYLNCFMDTFITDVTYSPSSFDQTIGEYNKIV